jgi:hypothetical protein
MPAPAGRAPPESSARGPEGTPIRWPPPPRRAPVRPRRIAARRRGCPEKRKTGSPLPRASNRRIVERREADERTVVIVRVVLGGYIVDLRGPGFPRRRISIQARLRVPGTSWQHHALHHLPHRHRRLRLDRPHRHRRRHRLAALFQHQPRPHQHAAVGHDGGRLRQLQGGHRDFLPNRDRRQRGLAPAALICAGVRAIPPAAVARFFRRTRNGARIRACALRPPSCRS